MHAYRSFPNALIKDAHQLYALAEEHKLLTGRHGTELLSLEDHYRFILLLFVSDLQQLRARQLPIVIDFLREAARDIVIQSNRPERPLNQTDFAVNLIRGGCPVPAMSLLKADAKEVRWFTIAPVLKRIQQTASRIKPSATGLLGSDTLERPTLARLQLALARTRNRRSARAISHTPKRVVFGHKEICAYLLYNPTEIPTEQASGWVLKNSSSQGACLHNDACRAGLVQVGELVSVTDPDKALREKNSSESSKLIARLGIVRWVHTSDKQGIILGVEFLANSVLPVRVVRENSTPGTQGYDEHMGDIGIGENALIVACRVQGKVLQTILLPSFLFQTTDKLLATQGGKSRRIQLRNCLQSNGLFSQFALTDS